MKDGECVASPVSSKRNVQKCQRAKKREEGKPCSQCQNRGQVEVYGGWLVFADWLSDVGCDADVAGGEVGGWEFALCLSQRGQQAAI